MSIINNKSDFLKKDIPSNNVGQGHIDSLFSNVSSYINNNVEDINSISDNMLLALDRTASATKNVMRSLRPLTNSIADIFAIGGESRDSLDIFRRDVDYNSDGVIIDYDTRQIRLDITPLAVYSIKNITVDADNGELGNSVEPKRRYFDIQNIVGSGSRLELESFTSELDATISIDLSEKVAINNIKFNLVNFGTRMPSIESIMVSEDGCIFTPIKIATSNSLSLNIEDFNFQDGIVSIHIEELYVRYIKINFLQKFPYDTGTPVGKRYAIGINNLEVGFYSARATGSMVVGPFKSKDEIFKVAIFGDMTRYNTEDPNIRLSISVDGSAWIPVQNSELFDPDSEISKIINFNNISNDSLTTQESVMKLYVRVEMDAVDVSYIAEDARYVNRETVSVSRSTSNFALDIRDDYDYLKVFRISGIKYGSRVSMPSIGGNLFSIPTDNIVFARSDSELIFKGLDTSSSNIIDVEKGSIDASDREGVTVQYKFDKIHIKRNDIIENIPTMGYDPFSIKLFSMSREIYDPVSIESTRLSVKNQSVMPIIPFSKNAGRYYLKYNGKTEVVDVESGFILDNRQLLYIVSDDILDVVLEDEIGRKISDISTVEVNGIKVISLHDALGVNVPDSSGLTFNKYYPLIPLLDNEFSISFNELRFGKYFKGEFSYPRVVISDIPTKIDKAIDDLRIITSSSRQIKHSEQLKEFDFENIIKLDKTNILEQSVWFDTRSASVNTFLKEVPFINGRDEFVLSEEYIDTDNRGLNVIQLHSSFLNSRPVAFKGCNGVFRNRVYSEFELIDIGDYWIDGTVIRLPENVFTDAANDTEISYSIEPNTLSTSGIYSIDYVNGIIHSSAKVDGNTIVNYMYSSVYATYSGLEKLDSDIYKVKGSAVEINTDSEAPEEHIIISSGKEVGEIEYLESPVLYNFKINIIDAESSV